MFEMPHLSVQISLNRYLVTGVDLAQLVTLTVTLTSAKMNKTEAKKRNIETGNE